MAIGVLVALKLPEENAARRTVALPEVVSRSGARGTVERPPSASGATPTSRQPGSSTEPRRRHSTTKPQRSPSPVTPPRAVTRSKHRKVTTRKRGHAAAVRSKLPRETRATVEREVLALVVQSPAGKLPSTLIDPQTGFAKNNLQAACRRTGNSRSFRCVVELAVKPPNDRVYVSYAPTRNGRGSFKWSRDPNG
jgi:hypothetical protein